MGKKPHENKKSQVSFTFFNPHSGICLLILEREKGRAERDRQRERH